nr:MAG TPA: hypothetical protein [Caudoviricetes sp.]DAW74547.1 MAG TPA: hypothetical protein [Caudoviricetes sp.]
MLISSLYQNFSVIGFNGNQILSWLSGWAK